MTMKLFNETDLNKELPNRLRLDTTDAHKVPIWKKPFLTISEAVEYFNIGRDKLTDLVGDNEYLVLMNGNRRLIKRQNLEKYLSSEYSI